MVAILALLDQCFKNVTLLSAKLLYLVNYILALMPSVEKYVLYVLCFEKIDIFKGEAKSAKTLVEKSQHSGQSR